MKFAFKTRLTALAATALISPLAQSAPVVNMSGPAHLSGWNGAGDVAVSATGAAGLTLSQTSLLLGTAVTDAQDDHPAPAGAYNISLSNPVAGGSTLETSVGLAPGALDDDINLHYAMEGSSVWKDFSVTAGDTLKVDWQLFARPGTSSIPLSDTAWLVWAQGASTQLIKLAEVLNTPMSAISNGWLASADQQYTLHASHTGTARLSLVVADMDSFDTTTVLSISNVVQTSAVPEPGSVMLVLAGLAMMVYMSHRQRHGHRKD
jgi:hypothetical protein